MKYQLIDLGKPNEISWAKAFIHTQDSDLLIKGGWNKVYDYLRRFGKAYFGKLSSYYPHKRGQVGNNPSVTVIAGNGLMITTKIVKSSKSHNWSLRGKRTIYEIRDKKYNILFKRVRRMPTKWIKEIFLDVDGQILVSSDLLKENGLDLAAQALLNLYHKANEV
jgi:hypothetical protein